MTEKLFEADIELDVHPYTYLEIRAQAPIPVVNDQGDLIGSASITQDDGLTGPICHLRIRYDCPERLDLETPEQSGVVALPRYEDIKYMTIQDKSSQIKIPSIAHLTKIVIAKP